MAKDEIEEATKWVGGLDRINQARGILTAYDFSATPFAPSGKKSSEEALFGWIVSDFGLNDAIESGLVKTPRVVVRDDAVPSAKTYKSASTTSITIPKSRMTSTARRSPRSRCRISSINGYYLLGYDWRETARAWASVGFKTPPVMITVANRTETAARVKYALTIKRSTSTNSRIPPEPCILTPRSWSRPKRPRNRCADERRRRRGTGGRDENGDEEPKRKLTKKQQAELLRQQVDTVGQSGKPGEQIQNVISVGMLSEGWDAKTVTHIMGLRAFTSQLLCEQVVGRGLRRTAYELNPDTGLFDPEYVNIFGVPFTFLPHESKEGAIPAPPKPKTPIEPDPAKASFEISWPNVIRIDQVYRPRSIP